VKRLYFPRFFFLSDDELLEILAETRDPQRVQPHLKKCFEGIAELEFGPYQRIGAMLSSERERVEFTEEVDPAASNGAVEQWLVQIEAVMKASVRTSMKKSLAAYHSQPRPMWVLQWPGQVVLCARFVHLI
jgi:dynein heavy chain